MPASPFPRLASLIACLMLALAVAACGDDSEPQPDVSASEPERATPGGSAGAGEDVEAPTEIVGGRSVLRLDSDVRTLLGVAGVEIRPVGDASEVTGGIALPIEGGQLDIDTPSGSIQHSGGIELAAGDQSVEVTQFELRPEDGAVSAEVNGERVELFSADVGQPRVPQTGDVIVLPTTLGLREEGVQMLNDILGVDLFHSDLRFGRLTVDAARP